MDDLIAKFCKAKNYVVNIRMLFERLLKFQLKLNLTKCIFGTISSKLLSFLVSEKKIEVNSNEIWAIQGLSPFRTQKKVRGFYGKLNYIGRFISQLIAKCDPIFKLFCKHDPSKWNDECQMTFEKIKEYSSNPPILVPLCHVLFSRRIVTDTRTYVDVAH